MARQPSCFFSLAVTLCVLLQEGVAHPPAESPLAAPTSGHLRMKRCSCNNWMDKECIYFCHLDIIWINTPGHSTPYGLGNPRRRRKRSLGRCECSHSKGSVCPTFCHGKPWDLRNPRVPMKTGFLVKLFQRSTSKHPELSF